MGTAEGFKENWKRRMNSSVSDLLFKVAPAEPPAVAESRDSDSQRLTLWKSLKMPADSPRPPCFLWHPARLPSRLALLHCTEEAGSSQWAPRRQASLAAKREAACLSDPRFPHLESGDNVSYCQGRSEDRSEVLCVSDVARCPARRAGTRAPARLPCGPHLIKVRGSVCGHLCPPCPFRSCRPFFFPLRVWLGLKSLFRPLQGLLSGLSLSLLTFKTGATAATSPSHCISDNILCHHQ